MHTLALLLSLFVQEPKTETVTIPGTDLKFEMVYVPGGKAKLGSPADEAGRKADEMPIHEIELRPFWMSRTEVTWEAFVKYFENRKAAKVDGVTRPSPPYEPPHGKMGVGTHPAVSMRWHGAMGFCEWTSTLTGQRFRLPTEAEFEYAARAGSGAAGPANPAETCWFKGNAENKTHLTGTLKPNAFGLHDLMGNVWEYALEYHDGPDYDPVLRGGGWPSAAGELRFAARQQILPEWYERDPNRPRSMWWLTDGTFVGFRLVRFADAPRKDQEAYAAKVELSGLKASEGTKGNSRVTGTLKNAGDRALDEVELTVYFTDDDGKPVYEDNKFRPTFSKVWPVLVNSDRPGEHAKALKPGESRGFQVDVPQAFDIDAEPTKVGAKVAAVQFSK
ncbi:MAG: formylglycine-generating enzyme family protein [Planctomycetaceae bacterium]|nr:formylglycine-generating enzyme family protein [Planctomycetaceae bacterium]